jgi:hypothetical protein
MSEQRLRGRDWDEANRRSNDLSARMMDIYEDSSLTDDEKHEAIDRLVDEVQAIPAKDAGKLGERRGLFVKPPTPLTRLESEYLAGRVRIVSCSPRRLCGRTPRPPRRRAGATANTHGPPSRLDDSDEPEPPLGRLLQAIAARVLGWRS